VATAPAQDQPLPVPSLTRRQRTVLEMLAEGKPARRIAAELQLSEMTVRNHIRAILRELGCNSQLAAVAEARRLGLV
jgi:DNA-binding CsgD family transcriptional regulator